MKHFSPSSPPTLSQPICQIQKSIRNLINLSTACYGWEAILKDYRPVFYSKS